MTDYAQVVVVGGGVTGCSVLYHLVKKGWSDVVLCERTELTAGSTWHSAGHVILYTLNPTISRLNQYGVELYRQLEEETGQNPGFHTCGNMRLATHPDRLLEMKRYLGVADITGVEAHMLGPEEIAAMHPFIDLDGVLAGIYNPRDGHIAPADLTMALASGARQGGAKIHRNRQVNGFHRTRNGEWLVHTDQGDICCEHVVSATGNYTRQTMHMVGLPGHSVPVKHQFVVTEPIAELVERRRQGLPELPVFRDPEKSFYVRQEADGLAMGAYESKGEAVFVDGVPASFGQDLFPDELDKLLPFFEQAMERLPLLANAGIHSVINGPMPYTPDDLPLTGPAPGLDNFWLAEGNPFGITLAGGVGWQLAQWIVEGEPGIDMWSCDPRRYGSHATRAYCALKTEEAYEHTYRIPKPGEELEAARLMKSSPLHDLLEVRGAVFGETAGWESANWFAPSGSPAKEQYSFSHSNAFAPVGNECRAVRETAGLTDITAQARFVVEGPDGASLLDELVASRLPEIGTVATCYVLTRRGTVRSQLTIWHQSKNRFFVTGPITAEIHDFDLLSKAAASSKGECTITNLTGQLGGLLLLGPQAPTILADIDDDNVVPIMASGNGHECTLALAPVQVIRQDYGGEDGFYIHTPVEFLRRIFHALMEAGKEHGLSLVGARALASLRLEQANPLWGSELGRSVDLLSAGLETAVDFSKPSFRGRKELLARQQAGVSSRLVLLELDDGAPFDPVGSEPVRSGDGTLLGHTTSGGYGHTISKALALAYLNTARLDDNGVCDVVVLGENCKAKVRAVKSA